MATVKKAQLCFDRLPDTQKNLTWAEFYCIFLGFNGKRGEPGGVEILVLFVL